MVANIKVGFVLSQPFGSSLGTDVRIGGLAEGLSNLGVEVHVITPFLDHFSMSQSHILVHRLPSRLTRFGVSSLIYRLSRKFLNSPFLSKTIVRCKSPLSKSADSLGKNIYKIIRKLNLTIVQAEQQLASLACINIRRQLNVPIVADFHGIWTEEMVASDIIEHGDYSYKTLFHLEHEIACCADAVTVVSEEMKSYIENCYPNSIGRVFLIPNATIPRARNARITECPSKVIHSGTLHPWENVELFIQGIPTVLKRHPLAKFYLTRKGAKLKKIRRLARELGVHPEFTWFPKSNDFFDFLKSCDVGVISSTTKLARIMAYPQKLYDYLSVGLPVVANDIGAWTKILRENRVGIVTENHPKAFAEGILEFLENPDMINEYSQNAVDLVMKELNYSRTAEKLLDLYQKIL
jgi:glycosyltransferase involved in cell wall biosynthesis